MMPGLRTLGMVGLLLLGVADLPVQAQPIEIAGIVVDETRQPMPQARVLILSHGFLNLDSKGQFRMTLGTGTSSVELQVVSPEGYEVLYPRWGFDVAGGPKSLYIVVGRPGEKVILDALSDQIANLEEHLHRRSDSHLVELQRLREEMLSSFEPVLEKLEIEREKLRQSVEARSQQVAVGSEVKELLNAYLLRAKDLRDYLAQLTPHLADDPAVFNGLQRVMADYSTAYAALDARKDSFVAAIGSAWGGLAGESLRRDWQTVYVQAVTRMHQGIVLPLNPALIVLQRAHTASRPRKSEVEEAISVVRAGVDELTREIPVLEKQLQQLYSALDTP